MHYLYSTIIRRQDHEQQVKQLQGETGEVDGGFHTTT